jgi:predicted DNA-binding transcriptional regulator YafY
VSTAGRFLTLLGLLESRRDWTSEALADRLGVTPRTVRRDVSRLRELGYPVDGLAGPGGGYSLGSGGSIPPLLLDEDEAVALAASLRITAQGDVIGFSEAGLTLLAKLEQVLPPRAKARIEDVTSTTLALAGPAAPPLDPATLGVLAHAARNCERVRFVYTRPEQEPMERHVEPFRMVFAFRRWYLVAFDRDRDDWRTFRLDRIRHPQATGIRFTRVDPPDPTTHVEEGLALATYAIHARVLLETSPEDARRYVAPSVALIQPSGDGRAVMVIGADEPDWIARYVAGIPVPFRVIEPPEVVEAVRRLAESLASYHRP